MIRATRPRLLAAVATAALLASIFVSGCGGKDKGSTSSSGSKPVALSPYSNIFVVNVTTKKVRALTRNDIAQLAQTPTWSKQGTIAFTQATCDECISKLVLIPPAGGKAQVARGQPKHVFQPTWSPDGKRLVVVRLGFGLYSVDPGKGESSRLTRNQADEAPSWSPNGKQVIFDAQVNGTNWDLFSIDPRGHNLQHLTRGPLQETNPTWSPNGSMIAFARQARNGNWVIQRMKAGGRGSTSITGSDVSSQEPNWSPDGSEIAYVEQAGPRAYLSVVSVHGGESRRLTGNSLVVSHPSWSPDGKEIVFSGKGASTDPSKFPEVTHEGEVEGGGGQGRVP